VSAVLLEPTVERQAEAIGERVMQGSRSGAYAVTHLGRHLFQPAGAFIASGPKAEKAWVQFVKAVIGFERRRNPGSLATVEASLRGVESLIGEANLSQEEASFLRRELEHHRAALLKQEQAAAEVAEKAAGAGRRAAPRRAGDMADIAAKIALGRVQNAFYDAVQRLGTLGTRLTAEERTLMKAYRQVSAAIGSEMEGGWKPAFDYLTANIDSVKAWKKEFDRLSALLAKAETPSEVEKLTRAFEAERKSGVHSKLKGLLGELFATHWQDWQLIKSGYKELAHAAARRLGPEWEPLSVAGQMFLGGRETWDEAILLVNRQKTPFEAKLFLAAQFKAAVESRAVDQTLADLIREAERSDLRAVLQGGGEEFFLLTPMPPGEKAYRWVLNAAGGAYPTGDIARLFEQGVKAHQQTLPVTLQGFNRLADALLSAAAAAL
jgi:hypothetical protein